MRNKLYIYKFQFRSFSGARSYCIYNVGVWPWSLTPWPWWCHRCHVDLVMSIMISFVEIRVHWYCTQSDKMPPLCSFDHTWSCNLDIWPLDWTQTQCLRQLITDKDKNTVYKKCYSHHGAFKTAKSRNNWYYILSSTLTLAMGWDRTREQLHQIWGDRIIIGAHSPSVEWV